MVPNQQETKQKKEMNDLQSLGSSETTRVASSKKNKKRSLSLYSTHFKSWLAGIIDGDGCLLLSKEGLPSCEITVGEDEKDLLSLIKERLGGGLKLRKGVGAYRYRLHNQKGISLLLSLLEGRLRTSIRQEQFEKLSAVTPRYRDLYLGPKKDPSLPSGICKGTLLSKDLDIWNKRGDHVHTTYWLAGFFDAEGYLNINKTSMQCSVTLSQKDPEVLFSIKEKMGGSIFYDKSWQGYLYSASSLSDLDKWFSYFDVYPLKSSKKVIRLKRFKRFLLYKSRGYHLKGAPLREKKKVSRLLLDL